MSESIIDKISQNPSEITEDDIENWILSEVVEHFEPKFSSLSSFAYGSAENGGDLARRAFRELATKTLRKGLKAFILKSQHWRSGRKIQPYLTTCLNRLADNIKRDVSSQAKVSVPVCPACKALGQREFLRQESGRILRCHACTVEQDNIEDRLPGVEPAERVRLESELRLRRTFSTHSKKGYRCPGCSRFIPESCAQTHNVSCPYDAYCDWFGHIDELEPMAHPLGLSSHNHISLNSTIKFDSGKEMERQDSIKAENINADVQIEFRQMYREDLKILHDVIDTQYNRMKAAPSPKAIKKVLMYEAFKSMLDKSPEDMVSYLVRQNHSGDLPIQARIFQEFIDIVEDSLPLKVTHQGEVVEVYSLQDPRLDLFTGLSEFESFVKPDGTIPNMTKEFYVGGRLMKHSNRCFLGKLIDVRAVDIDQSLLSFVDFYTFSQIKMSDEIPIGTRVTVRHFRIPSHYEMHGLVYLQRIRRKIVDSVHMRLHGTRRKINGKEN